MPITLKPRATAQEPAAAAKAPSTPSKTSLKVSLPPDLIRRLDEFAVLMGQSRSAAIGMAIYQLLVQGVPAIPPSDSAARRFIAASREDDKASKATRVAKQITVSLAPFLWDGLKQLARSQDQREGAMARMAIQGMLDRGLAINSTPTPSRKEKVGKA